MLLDHLLLVLLLLRLDLLWEPLLHEAALSADRGAREIGEPGDRTEEQVRMGYAGKGYGSGMGICEDSRGERSKEVW
jgi:hypothetical protein